MYSVPSVETEGACIAIEDTRLALAIAVTTTDAKVELTANVFRDTLPDSLLNTDSRSKSSYPENNLQAIYTFLTNHYNRRATEGGYNRFVEAVNEISIAKVEACSGSSKIHPQDEHQLIQEFITAYKMENKSGHLLRTLYGKILCHYSTNVANSRVRRESRLAESSGKGYSCPPNGLDSNFSSCEFGEFYACLNENDTLEVIFFGPNYDIDTQCLAFVIDTTESMEEEIDTAKRIILDFLRSEQDIGIEGRYILVPFNDVVVGHDVANRSKL